MAASCFACEKSVPKRGRRRCPLCGQANTCAMEIERASGVQQPPCWCLGVIFGPEVLARVPADARNSACICVACATAG